MKLKEEWKAGEKNEGEPSGPPSFLFEPSLRRSGRFPPLPYPPPRLASIA